MRTLKDLDLGETLCSYLVRRSPRLQHISFVESYATEVFLYIPRLMYDVCQVSPPPTLSFSGRLCLIDDSSVRSCLYELARREYDGLKSFSLHELYHFPPNEILKSLNNLMEFNGNTTESLILELRGGTHLPGRLPLSLPRMKKLNQLHILNREYCKATPATFLPGQFPALRDLCLGDYRAEWHLFPASMVIPTLKEFEIRKYIGKADAETWHLSFPNLERFTIDDFQSADHTYTFLSFMKYFLSHMTMVVHLKLKCICPLRCFEDAMWRLYTGGAVPVSTKEVLQIFYGNNVRINESLVRAHGSYGTGN